MRQLQNVIALDGVCLIIAINLLPDLSYKGMIHPVGSDDVRVYAANAKNVDPTVPILAYEDDDLSANVGQRVHVYLRTDYRDKHLLAKPNLTLLLIGGFVVLYCLAGIIARDVAVNG